MDCYKWPGLFPSVLVAPLQDLTNLFFNVPALEQVRRTRAAALKEFCAQSISSGHLRIQSDLSPSCVNATDFAKLLSSMPMEFGLPDSHLPAAVDQQELA